MDHFLLLLLPLLCLGPGAQGHQVSLEFIRLVGGVSRCAGTLELNHQGEWRQVDVFLWSMKTAAAFCKLLDCGSALSVGQRRESSLLSVFRIVPSCIESGLTLKDCLTSRYSYNYVDLTCSDSVRLLNRSSVCSGRLEINSEMFNQSKQSNQGWSSVCEEDFDLQDAEVVCRELGCGSPVVLQGALHGGLQTPRWSAEFQCGGNESALVDCQSSSSARSNCSPVALTCSELNDNLRLVGGARRCEGTLEFNNLGHWRPVYVSLWTLKTATSFCQHLDCGSPLHAEQIDESTEKPVWLINPSCVQSGSSPSNCVSSENFSSILKLNCSDSVRLLNGSSLCSGRLEINSELFNQTKQSKQLWSPVCEEDFDLQGAEVVCRELGCGSPVALERALHGAWKAPRRSPEFQCGGNESALVDCRSSSSARSSCSPVGLTCSEPLRLVGRASRCEGTLEMKHQGEWRPVHVTNENLHVVAAFCERLHCGPAISVERSFEVMEKPVWRIRTDRLQAGDDLRDIVSERQSFANTKIFCSERQQEAEAVLA